MKRKLLVIIFALIPCLFLTLAKKVNAENATLEFKHNSFGDNTIIVDIYLDTGGNTVNGVTSNFVYPSEYLSIENLDTTTNTLFLNYLEKDTSRDGLVLLSFYSLEGVNDTGNIASVTFTVLQQGEATLEFTDDAVVLDAYDSTNILGETEPVTYNISQDVFALPETGETEDVLTFTGLIALILLVMIAIFALLGFSIWGGVYFSLGKWQVSSEAGVEIKKKEKGKKKIKAKLSVKSKKESRRK